MKDPSLPPPGRPRTLGVTTVGRGNDSWWHYQYDGLQRLTHADWRDSAGATLYAYTYNSGRRPHARRGAHHRAQSRAGRLAPTPQEYRWSSASAHLAARDDGLVRVAPVLELAGGTAWLAFLAEGVSEEQAERFRRHERTGRPLGDEGFVTRLERVLGRVLRPHKRGPKGPWKHNGRRPPQ